MRCENLYYTTCIIYKCPSFFLDTKRIFTRKITELPVVDLKPKTQVRRRYDTQHVGDLLGCHMDTFLLLLFPFTIMCHPVTQVWMCQSEIRDR